MNDLHVDPKRVHDCPADTGIYVRAIDPAGEWISADISQLDRASLTAWLRSRGGENQWAENVVLILLGHESC